MKAKDYRSRARLSLDGKWGLAVGTTFVASLLGGVTNNQITFNFETDDTSFSLGDSAYFSSSVDESVDMSPEAMESVFNSLWDYMTAYLFVVVVFAIVALILGGATRAGLCRFNKNLYYGNEAKFKDIFTHYDMLPRTIWANVLRALLIMGWTIVGAIPSLVLMFALFQISINDILGIVLIVACMILMVVPATIAMLSYSMTFYILDENPDMTAYEAISASGNLMKGHKWQYACLIISFYGWLILASITVVGMVFYNPYYLAAEYAFYNQIAHGGETPEETGENGQSANTEIVDVPVEEAPIVEA